MWAPVCSPPSMLLQRIRGGIGRSVLIIAQLAVYMLGCFICCLLSCLTCHGFQRDLGYSRCFSLHQLLWQLLACFELCCNLEPVGGMTLWPNNALFTLSSYQDLTPKLCSTLLVKKKKKQPKTNPNKQKNPHKLNKKCKSQTIFRVKDICREKELERSWCLWREFLKDLGERVVGGGRPNSVLLKHPHSLWNSRALFSLFCWLMALWQQPTDHLRGGLIQNYRRKQWHWKQWLVWNYLTCFPCFKELLLWQQQLGKDQALQSFRGSAVMCVWRGCITSSTKLCSLHPPFWQIPTLPYN